MKFQLAPTSFSIAFLETCGVVLNGSQSEPPALESVPFSLADAEESFEVAVRLRRCLQPWPITERVVNCSLYVCCSAYLLKAMLQKRKDVTNVHKNQMSESRIFLLNDQ